MYIAKSFIPCVYDKFCTIVKLYFCQRSAWYLCVCINLAVGCHTSPHYAIFCVLHCLRQFLQDFAVGFAARVIDDSIIVSIVAKFFLFSFLLP